MSCFSCGFEDRGVGSTLKGRNLRDIQNGTRIAIEGDMRAILLSLVFIFSAHSSEAAEECARALRQRNLEKYLEMKKLREEERLARPPAFKTVERFDGMVEVIRNATDWQQWFYKNSGYLGEGVYLFVMDSQGQMTISTRSEFLGNDQVYMASYEVLRQDLAASGSQNASPEAVVGGQIRILNGQLSFFHTCSQFSCGNQEKFESARARLTSWGAELSGERVSKFVTDMPKPGMTYEDLEIPGGGYYGSRDEAEAYAKLQNDPALWRAYHRHRAFLRSLYFMEVRDPAHPERWIRLGEGTERAGKVSENLFHKILEALEGTEHNALASMPLYNLIHGLQDEGAVLYTMKMKDRLDETEKNMQEVYNILHQWNRQGNSRVRAATSSGR